MRVIVVILLGFFLNMLNAELVLKEGERPRSRLDHLPKNRFKDMRTIPQNISFYAKQVQPMSLARQKRYDRDYNIKYFMPWNLKRVNISRKFRGWEIRMVKRRRLYNSRGRVIPNSLKRRWIRNTNFKALDSVRLKAVTIRHTNLKAMPTGRAFYLSNKRYANYFNYNQNSALYPNTPLYISHYSRDRKWAYVIAPYSFGWVKRSDIAIANRDFRKSFKSGKYGVAIKDNLRVYSGGARDTLVKLGTIFPIRNGKYILARKGAKGYAKIAYLDIQDSGIVAKKPLRFNAKNVEKVAKEFVGEPYGWGGSYFSRDCSATTKDFFAPFGIFLSRNSAAQAREGRVLRIPRRGYLRRKRFILKHAKPFRSLMFVPGHISLYIGQYKGEPVIMHTYWGVRKKDWSKIVTSRTIISTLELGKERRDTKAKSRLIYTLKKIVTF